MRERENVKGCGRSGNEGSQEDCLVWCKYLLCSLSLYPPVRRIRLPHRKSCQIGTSSEKSKKTERKEKDETNMRSKQCFL